ncbi:hypothetical protein ES703_113216 [subsurface metagenome]
MAKDLRTLHFYAAAIGATTTIGSHLFDRAIKIKKIVYNAAMSGTASASGNVYFGKHETIAAHDRVGDFLHVQLTSIYTAAAGGSFPSVVDTIDLGDDYVDVQEDEYLYLIVQTSVALANTYGRVTIYYVDK